MSKFDDAMSILNSGKTTQMSADIITYERVCEWWKSLDTFTEEGIRAILKEFNIQFTYNSNNVENINISYHTTREIFTDGKLSDYSGDFLNLMSIHNQKFATEIFIRSLANKEPITVDFILRLHKVMLYGCYDTERWDKGERPGTIKKGDYCVGLTDEGSYPEDAYSDLVELCNEVTEVLKSGSTKRILTVASYFHLRFEQIHPFADGNGRVGRQLMNYILMLGGHPPTVIFNDDKETYYLALEVFDRSEEISGFKEFVKEQVVKTWYKSVRCLNE